jgi:frataxin-like iron-binding protein CyaY
MGVVPGRIVRPRPRDIAMNETEFTVAADRALAAIGEAIDVALEASDQDVDWSVNDGILEIECDDGS